MQARGEQEAKQRPDKLHQVHPHTFRQQYLPFSYKLCYLFRKSVPQLRKWCKLKAKLFKWNVRTLKVNREQAYRVSFGMVLTMGRPACNGGTHSRKFFWKFSKALQPFWVTNEPTLGSQFWFLSWSVISKKPSFFFSKSFSKSNFISVDHSINICCNMATKLHPSAFAHRVPNLFHHERLRCTYSDTVDIFLDLTNSHHTRRYCHSNMCKAPNRIESCALGKDQRFCLKFLRFQCIFYKRNTWACSWHFRDRDRHLNRCEFFFFKKA